MQTAYQNVVANRGRKRSARTESKGKGKAIPVQARTGPEVSRRLRLPDTIQAALEGGDAVSPIHRPHLPPGNTPGTQVY
jgi:hypothetical protein